MRYSARGGKTTRALAIMQLSSSEGTLCSRMACRCVQALSLIGNDFGQVS